MFGIERIFDIHKIQWPLFIRRWMKPLISPGSCSIGITPENVALSFYSKVNPNELVLAVADLNAMSVSVVLTELIKQYQLQNYQASIVLSSNEYHLFLLDNPPVPQSEFQAAIRWKIANLIPFSLEEAIIDAFPVPLQFTHNPKQMIMVVVTQRNFLQAQVDLLRRVGLQPFAINIQQLALRNITALFETDQRSSALIYLQKNTSEIIITSEKQIYFQRYLNFRLSELNKINERRFDQGDFSLLNEFILDIQRSFDYYEIQWRKAKPARFYLIFSEPNFLIKKITHYLSEHLSIFFDVLDLNPILFANKKIELSLQYQFLPVIGDALFLPGIKNHLDQLSDKQIEKRYVSTD